MVAVTLGGACVRAPTADPAPADSAVSDDTSIEEPATRPFPETWSEVAVGSYAACGIGAATGEVWCWGIADTSNENFGIL